MKKIGGFLYEVVLREHLAYNHFPPIDGVFIGSAMGAISRAEEDDWDSLIDLPNGVTLTVRQIIEELHLEDFIGIGEEE